MIKFNRTVLIISPIILWGLTGCGSVKSYFPDKEKDYQYSAEIAPLAVPVPLTRYKIKQPVVENVEAIEKTQIDAEKDMVEEVVVISEIVEEDGYVVTSTAEPKVEKTAKTAKKPTADENKITQLDESNNVVEVKETNESVPVEDVEKQDEVNQDEVNQVVETNKRVDAEDEAVHVDFVMFDGGATRLRINEKLEPAWRLVSKALTRNRIEVVERNLAKGQLVVQYDPNKTDFKDETIADEFFFVFGKDHSQEKEYRVRVMEHNANVEVIVLDAEDKPLSDGIGLNLLKVLFTTIHTELAAKK